MLSALIPSERCYPAMPLARQLVHRRFVHPGPLVLGTDSLKYPTPASDRDRTVSRRSKPSSRTTLIGEQPNPWNLLQLQDVMSRHRTFSTLFVWCRLYLHLPLLAAREDGDRVYATRRVWRMCDVGSSHPAAGEGSKG